MVVDVRHLTSASDVLLAELVSPGVETSATFSISLHFSTSRVTTMVMRGRLSPSSSGSPVYLHETSSGPLAGPVAGVHFQSLPDALWKITPAGMWSTTVIVPVVGPVPTLLTFKV